MDRALLDTDIFSEILKGRNQNVVTKAIQYRSAYGYYSISVITVLEIVKGFHKLQREDRVQQFLDGLPCVELLTLDQRSAALALPRPLRPRPPARSHAGPLFRSKRR